MTVITAMVRDGVAVMAADSRQSWGTSYVDGVVKVSRHGDALVGMAGMAVFERARPGFPDLEPGADDERVHEWCRALVDGLRAWGKDQGHGQMNGPVSDQQVELLVVTRTGVWYVGGEGSVLKVPRGWHAIGSGAPEALGAMAALSSVRFDDGGEVHTVYAALAAASVAVELDSSCGGEVRQWVL